MKRFWEKVKKTEYCWEWIAGKSPDGYGKFKVNGTTVRAHRFSWELKYGTIPKGLLACHKCDNILCVRPGHLFLGSPSENTRDMLSKNRGGYGTKNGSNKLSWISVCEIRQHYKTGEYSQQEIANTYGVNQTLVSAIVRKKVWKDEHRY